MNPPFSNNFKHVYVRIHDFRRTLARKIFGAANKFWQHIWYSNVKQAAKRLHNIEYVCMVYIAATAVSIHLTIHQKYFSYLLHLHLQLHHIECAHRHFTHTNKRSPTHPRFFLYTSIPFPFAFTLLTSHLVRNSLPTHKIVLENYYCYCWCCWCQPKRRAPLT